MIKMTFTVDEATAASLERASARQGIPKSQVVREAVRLYGEQLGRLTDEEREVKLRVFDEVMASLPNRSPAEVDDEVETVRRARREGGARDAKREASRS